MTRRRAIRILVLVLALIAACLFLYLIPEKHLPLRAAECAPDDQDRYVYSPERLLTLSPCLRVVGTVRSLTLGAEDGDAFFDLEVDAPYRNLLNVVNDRNTRGYLHVESVCYRLPEDLTQPPALTCMHDLNPYRGPFPKVGSRVWVEGRWVWDLNHGGHAELHPLYRWGELK